MQSFRFLADDGKTSEDGLKHAAVIGWCVEWVRTYDFVAVQHIMLVH